MQHDHDRYRERDYVPDTFWLVVAVVLDPLATGCAWRPPRPYSRAATTRPPAKTAAAITISMSFLSSPTGRSPDGLK